VAARAVNRERRKPPPDEPRLLARDVSVSLVDRLVWMGHINYSVGEYYRQGRRRRKPVHIHERWVETLMTPDLELKGEVPELIELQTQTEEWRDAVFLRPRIEDVVNAGKSCKARHSQPDWTR